MKKTILGLAFLTIASVSFGAFAQQKQNNATCSNTECVAKDKKACKGDKVRKDRKGGKDVNRQKAAARQAALFEGLNLTTEQQGKIEALNNAVKVSRQEIKDQAKAAREKGDTTFSARKLRKDLRSKYVNDLGEILTADQMTVYLKNFYVNSGDGHKGGKKAMALRGGQGRRIVKAGEMHKMGDRRISKAQFDGKKLEGAKKAHNNGK